MKRLASVVAMGLWGMACSSSSSSPATGGLDAGADASVPTVDAGGDGPAACTPVTWTDSLRPQRDACTFTAGAKAADTIGLTEAARLAIPIKHVVVLMKENRSFDHIFGQLSKSGQPDAEPVPATWASPDKNGTPVPPSHATTTCVPADPPHQWDNMHAMSNGGKMDGFVTNGTKSTPPTDGTFTMQYLDATDIPFYYWLANTFAVADHHFPSVLSGTWSNRDYLVAATSHGTKNTGTDPALTGVPLIFDALDTAGVSWDVYTDDIAPLEYSVAWGKRKAWKSVQQFQDALAAGTLPAVAFVDSTTDLAPPVKDEHPPADVQLGEAWTRSIYEATVKSPLWPTIALFYTYDEAGGFGDHVPPPKSCAPSADQSDFTELGVRVPLVVVSPYAKRHFVSHAVHQHTSILRFIETLFAVPALTARDANSDAMLDMFDFSCQTPAAVPDAPAAGTGRCP
jgi:phospholipase C